LQSPSPWVWNFRVAQGGQEAGERHLLGELQGRGDGGRAQEDPRESHAKPTPMQM
jgi:hypothetical protein